MTTFFLDAVFKPFFKIVHDTGQQLTIDRTNFLTDGFLQIIQRTGFVSVNTRFQIPPKKKITRWKIGRARGPRHVSETGNEVPRKHVSNNGHWLVCSVRCGTILLKPHMGTVDSSSAQFWVLPIQNMSGSRGTACITRRDIPTKKTVNTVAGCALNWLVFLIRSLLIKIYCLFSGYVMTLFWAGQLSRYSDWLRAGRSGIKSRWGARFSARPDRPWGPSSLL